MSKFNKNIHYTLNYNREESFETFKKIYFFLLKESGKKLSKEELYGEISKTFESLVDSGQAVGLVGEDGKFYYRHWKRHKDIMTNKEIE